MVIAFLKLVNAHGLKTEHISPYTPEQNGVVERFMQTMKEECIWLHAFPSFNEAKRINEGTRDIRWEEHPFPPPQNYDQGVSPISASAARKGCV
jgi:transposase InsO family protein